jgi:sterol 3beta-glucosyltransferase
MKAVVLALGSYGDLVPYAALGQRLQAAGHEVVVFTSENYGPLVRRFGLSLHPFPGDAEAVVKAAGANLPSLMWASRGLSRGFAQGYGRLADLMDGAGVILNQLPGGVFGFELSELFQVPMALVSVIPLVRTGAFPLAGMPRLPGSPSIYNRLTYRLGEQLAWQVMRPIVNNWRINFLGLPGSPFWGPVDAIYTHSLPILNGFSNHIFARPPDWGDHVRVTGYWFPEDQAWRPPEALVRFIEHGNPPVFIGFGSMPVKEPRRTLELIAQALGRCGLRGVVGAGWGSLDQYAVPDHLHILRYAPYDWLFPRMAAVLHHGGSGTTGFALRAGIPSMVVPFLFDQYFWGSQTARLGVGPRPIPFGRLSSARLAAALDVLLEDNDMHRRAALLGEKIRAEDGFHGAVRAIEQVASHHIQPRSAGKF